MRNIPHKNFLQKVRKTVLRLNVAIFFADSKLSPPLNYLKNCLANKTTFWNFRRNQFPMSNCGPIWAKSSNIKGWNANQTTLKNSLVSKCEVSNERVWIFRNVKHEYLRSRAYICLSLSSPFPPSSSSPVMVSQLWPLSRYSCCYLGSWIPTSKEFLFWSNWQ